MTIQEILKAHGLEDEAIEKVLADMKTNKIYTSAEENLDIRYGKLKGDFDTLTEQKKAADELVEKLKKDAKGSEDLQGTIKDYETTVRDLESKLEAEKLENALKVALLEAKASDVGYLTFKLKEKGELELDDNGEVKDIKDKIDTLKTEFPNQFEGSGKKKYFEKKLDDHDDDDGVKITKDDFNKMGYRARVEFKEKNPDAYQEFTK